MEFKHSKTPEFFERKIDVSEIADWAKQRNFGVLHQDKDANVIMVGEDHTDYATFLAEKDLIEKVRPNFVILESIAAGTEVKKFPRFWTLAEAEKTLGEDTKIYANQIFELAKRTLNERATATWEREKAEDLLEEGETVESIRDYLISNFPFPKNADELYNLPFYLWHRYLEGGFMHLRASEQSDLPEKIAAEVKMMIPFSRSSLKGDKARAFGIIHSAVKTGARVVGLDDLEAKWKVIEVLRTANLRRSKKSESMVLPTLDQTDETLVADLTDSLNLLTKLNFTTEEKKIIEEQSKRRRETMAQSIAQRTQDGSLAVVITGSNHVDPKSPQSYIPLDAIGIKRIAIKQQPNPNAGLLAGSDYINRLTK